MIQEGLPGPLVAIVGPTASGKSSLAEKIATELQSSVVSVDAMQVYRGMDIGTAKTPVAERVRPLLMVDVADVGEAYSARRYQRDARREVDSMLLEGKVPVLCGGTGLYLNALIDEMDFPAGVTGGESRAPYERMAAEKGPMVLYGLLVTRDPESAALIHPNNVRRVVRALELADEGKSYAKQHEGLHRRKPHYRCAIWGIRRDREELYHRIERRVDAMVSAGLVDEVRALLDRGLGEALTATQAIGYKEVIDYLQGSCSLDEAIATIKMRSRRYAKRQISWFSHDGRVRWLDLDALPEDQAARIILDELESEKIVCPCSPDGEGSHAAL